MDDPPFPPLRPFPPPPGPPPGERGNLSRGGTDATSVAGSLVALAGSRDRLLAASARGRSELVAALESDPGLLGEALRCANGAEGSARTVGSAGEAVDALGAGALESVARGLEVVDPLADDPALVALVLGRRTHALAVRDVARRLAAETGGGNDGYLVSAALLHDVGKLECDGPGHAEAGAWLLRRWRVPERLAVAVEGHHDNRLGLAATIRLADMLVHVREGRAFDRRALLSAAMVSGVARSTLAALLTAPASEIATVSRSVQAPPLSPRELEVLRAVGAQRLPKQIAAELGLAEATVRSHLRRIYQRLGVADRTQAVLVAREHGWLE